MGKKITVDGVLVASSGAAQLLRIDFLLLQWQAVFWHLHGHVGFEHISAYHQAETAAALLIGARTDWLKVLQEIK